METLPSEFRDEIPSENVLVIAAVEGDRVALEQLLLAYYDRLATRISMKLPARLQSTQAVEDVLQNTFCQAFRDISRFCPRDDASFGDWLEKIADHRLGDAIKQQDRKKRGGDWCRISEEAGADGSVRSLWETIADGNTSPGSVAAQNEALHALQIALAALPNEQRMAIQLRHLEGKSLEETATILNRTTDAVRGLVHRGKQALLASMGRASHWLKSR